MVPEHNQPLQQEKIFGQKCVILAATLFKSGLKKLITKIVILKIMNKFTDSRGHCTSKQH